MTEKLTLTVREVHELTGVPIGKIENDIRLGRLNARDVSTSSRPNRRILRSDIQPWLESLDVA
jgi:hypothetical protein